MAERSVDELLPAVLAQAAVSVSERVGSPSPEQIRRRGELRHRRRIAATVSASLAAAALVGATVVVALDGGPRSGQPIAPIPTATRTTSTSPATVAVRQLPPGTRLRIAAGMLLPANAVPSTPANRPWIVVPVLADGDTNCRAPGDQAVAGAQRAVSQKYLVDVPGAGSELDSASEALYETPGDRIAWTGYNRLVAEPNLCPGTPKRRPGREIQGNGGVGRVWLLGSGASPQAYVGLGYKANVVVVIDRLVYARSGVGTNEAAATERMLLNAFARLG